MLSRAVRRALGQGAPVLLTPADDSPPGSFSYLVAAADLITPAGVNRILHMAGSSLAVAIPGSRLDAPGIPCPDLGGPSHSVLFDAKVGVIRCGDDGPGVSPTTAELALALVQTGGRLPVAVIATVMTPGGSAADPAQAAQLADRLQVPLVEGERLLRHWCADHSPVRQIGGPAIEVGPYGSFDRTVFEDSRAAVRYTVLAKGIQDGNHPVSVRICVSDAGLAGARSWRWGEHDSLDRQLRRTASAHRSLLIHVNRRGQSALPNHRAAAGIAWILRSLGIHLAVWMGPEGMEQWLVDCGVKVLYPDTADLRRPWHLSAAKAPQMPRKVRGEKALRRA